MKLPNLFRPARLKKAKRRERLELEKHEQRILSLLNGISLARRNSELKENFSCFVPLWNAVQYCNIADLDLSILTHQMMVADSDWRRKLNARILAMSLAECIEGTSQVLGKQFQNTVSIAFNGNVHLQELQIIRKKLTTFRKKHERMLREIRNIAAAHRDTDADLQLIAIDNTDVRIIWGLAAEFTGLLGRFGNLMTKVFPDLTSRIRALKKNATSL